jgi:hypothetical protein
LPISFTFENFSKILLAVGFVYVLQSENDREKGGKKTKTNAKTANWRRWSRSRGTRSDTLGLHLWDLNDTMVSMLQ